MSKKPNQPKPVFTFRLDPELIETARDLELHLPSVIEAAIAQALRRDKCPYCGHIKKKNKSKG